MFRSCLLPVAYNNGKDMQPKCGEIFYGNESNFLLVCVLCDMKHFDFEDFVRHIKNAHFDEPDIIAHDINTKRLSAERLEECIASSLPNGRDKEVNVFENLLLTDNNPLRILGQKGNVKQVEPIMVHTHFGSTRESSSTIANADWELDFVEEEVSVDSEDNSSGRTPTLGQATNYDDIELNRILKKPRQLKEYQCSHCAKRYTTEKYLNVHIQLAHLKPKPYKCDSCELAFTCERALNTHRRNVHIGFPCTLCAKTYKTKKQMLRHMECHSGERNYICEHENCGKTFRTQHCLTNHKRVHTRERNFVCEMCGYRSYYKDSLIVHRRSHTGEKPFKCDTCTRCFASKPLLIEHQAMHAKDRPYKCDICHAAFSRPKALYHHKHLHLGIKKFVCKICNNSYAQAAGLSAHMRNHKLSTSGSGANAAF